MSLGLANKDPDVRLVRNNIITIIRSMTSEERKGLAGEDPDVRWVRSISQGSSGKGHDNRREKGYGS